MFCNPCSRGGCTHPGYCPERGCWCWAYDDPRWRIRALARLRKRYRETPGITLKIPLASLLIVAGCILLGYLVLRTIGIP